MEIFAKISNSRPNTWREQKPEAILFFSLFFLKFDLIIPSPFQKLSIGQGVGRNSSYYNHINNRQFQQLLNQSKTYLGAFLG